MTLPYRACPDLAGRDDLGRLQPRAPVGRPIVRA